MHKSSYGHVLSFLSGKHVGAQYLGRMIGVCVTFTEIATGTVTIILHSC